jgi:Outer membrane protein beta-barrel domain
LKRKLMFLAAIVTVFSLYTQQARAQSDDRKVEIGGQFSFLQVPTVTANVCADLCPPNFFTRDSNTDVGFGPRIGYNATSYLTLEAEMNFFPRDRDSEGGRKVQGLFGAKAGKRFEKAGIFAKARPGFVRFSRGDYQFGTGGCPAVFPPPIGCFQPVAKTNFAIDIGGVAELYPSKNTIIRFDAGDTIIRFGQRNVASSSTTVTSLVVVFEAAETKHNLQVGVGFGYRF